MELKTCEYCATAYDASLEQCPLCGRPSGGAPRRGGKRLKKPERPARAPKNENPGQPEEPLYAIPKWRGGARRSDFRGFAAGLVSVARADAAGAAVRHGAERACAARRTRGN